MLQGHFRKTPHQPQTVIHKYLLPKSNKLSVSSRNNNIRAESVMMVIARYYIFSWYFILHSSSHITSPKSYKTTFSHTVCCLAIGCPSWPRLELCPKVKKTASPKQTCYTSFVYYIFSCGQSKTSCFPIVLILDVSCPLRSAQLGDVCVTYVHTCLCVFSLCPPYSHRYLASGGTFHYTAQPSNVLREGVLTHYLH